MTKHRLSYWEQRQVQNMYHYMEKAEDAADQIAKLYQKASGYISHQADAIFDKYQTKHRLTEAEAYRLINQLQDKASLDELLQKLRNGEDHQKELLAKLEAPAYQARLERLKQLQNQIDQIMTEVYDQVKQKNRSHYVDLGNEAYYRGIFDLQQQAEAAFGFSYISAKQIEAAVNRKWSGKNYSERIWKNTRLLAQELKQELLINLVTGRTNREVAEIIQNKFGKGASKARRLVRTESNYLATELNFKAYEECGVEKYQYLATLDLRTSEICRGLDGKLFLVKDRKAGVNCPPMHPWCRSTTISVVEESLIAKMQRSAIDPATGKRIKVRRSMNYEKWYDKYVRGKPAVEREEKKLKNRTADRSQHQKYRKVLADEVPENLDKFQEMKYNNSERWQFTKLDYQRQNELAKHPELKLPNAENVIVPDKKFSHYLFGGDHQKGLAKGAAFTSRLGYDINNWSELQNEITERAVKYPAVYKDNNGYGDRYEQKIVLYGNKGTPANVVVGWLLKPDGSVSMSSAYIKEVK